MLKKKWIKRVVMILFVSLILFTVNSSVFAAINEEYYDSTVSGIEVIDPTIDNKLSGDNILLSLLGNLVYGVGSLLEWVLGTVFKLITGTNIFPWADAILFNAIPFLDINVFNPSGMSFICIIQEFLQKAYYTVFTLALTFFGIAVAITAIKLAISAIAEEKAKYKKAIVDWLLGLVMLVGIHYFMSFALYLNEQLVATAGETVTDLFQDKEVKEIVIVEHEDEYYEKIVVNFIAAMRGVSIQDFLKLGINRIEDLIEEGSYFANVEESEKILLEHPRIAGKLLLSKEYRDSQFDDSDWATYKVSNGESFFEWAKRSTQYTQRLARDVTFISENTYEYVKEIYDLASKKDEIAGKCYAAMLAVYQEEVMHKTNDKAVISNLAYFFKESAWTVASGGWRQSKVVIESALMYAILVIQSLIFFIAYTKRLFYVIILIIMAPVVVVMDFFMKFGK